MSSTQPIAQTGSGKIKVTRLSSDARPLTAEEYRKYSPLVAKLRQGDNIRATSTTGRPLSGADGQTGSQSADNDHDQQLLLSSRSPLLEASRRRSQGPIPPPAVPLEPVAPLVPVVEQEAVLDLSAPSRQHFYPPPPQQPQ